ncbi:hypothetical protein ABPG72_017883 [Tetrahymena utriculariae]
MAYVNKRIFFEIFLQNTDQCNSQFNEQEKMNQIPTFSSQNFQSREKIQENSLNTSAMSVNIKFNIRLNKMMTLKQKNTLLTIYLFTNLQELSLLQDYYSEKDGSDIRKQRFINKKKDIDQVVQKKLDQNLDLDYSEKPVSGSLTQISYSTKIIAGILIGKMT